MTQDVVVVLDCGATNVRAIAVDTKGCIVAQSATANITETASEHPDWHEWPVEGIFEKFCQCSAKVMAQLQPEQVKAITVTTFGVDGTLVDKSGKPLYPVISWKCPRTAESQQNIKKYLDPEWLAINSGVGHFSFNTINKLIWFRENRPKLLQDAHAWLFISSLFNQKLTGQLTTDATMAGTAQLTDLQSQDFSDDILKALGLEKALFPRMVRAGELVGELLADVAKMLGLPAGIPVVSAGHDTQFAVYGSGADEGQPVLSSGTWEILMARAPEANNLSSELFEHGFTCEWDACQGLYNPGIQWLASGVLEWIGHQFYGEVSGAEKYQRMISEAEAVGELCQGVRVNPAFLIDSRGEAAGAIEGLTITTKRGAIYRAALQTLAEKLKSSLQRLEAIGGFQSQELILVGGGSKNALWNQIKANVLNLPIKILKESETTVLGAAMFAMAGAGLYDSPALAREAFGIEYEVITPIKNKSGR